MKAASDGCVAAAGEGVAGGAVAEAFVDGAGAGGAAGVEVAALEGVEGACEGVAVDEEALGYTARLNSLIYTKGRHCIIYLGDHAYYEALFFDVVRFDRLVILQDLTCRMKGWLATYHVAKLSQVIICDADVVKP